MELYPYYLEEVNNPIELRDELMTIPGKISIFDANRVICEDQIRVAVDRTLRAEEQKTMIAKIWGVELLLQLAGTHQIKDAIAILGISEETRCILIISDQSEFNFSGVKSGFPEFQPSDDLYKKYGLIGYTDPCSEIISKGVDLIINHQ